MRADPRDEIDETAVSSQLKKLRTAVDQEDFDVAIRLCEDLLSLLDAGVDDESTSLACLVYELYAKSLLHEKQYSKVLSLSPRYDGCRLIMDSLQAYAFYRIGQYDQALQLVTKLDASSLEIVSHIEAQSLYHMNHTMDSLRCYSRLKAASEETESQMELYTNAMAVLTANATPYDSNDTTKSIRDEASMFLCSQQKSFFPFDLAYNIASYDLLYADTMTHRQEALTMLQQAERACRDDLADEEAFLRKELEPIELNRSWGKSLWGEDLPPPDASTIAASGKVNSILKCQINPALAQESASKKTNEKVIQTLESLLHGGASSSHEGKLSALQMRLCRYNMAVLQLRLEDYDACRQTLDSLHNSLVVPKKKTNKKPKTQALVLTPPPSGLETLWWQVRVDVLSAYLSAVQWERGDDKASSKLEDAKEKLMGHLEKFKSMNNNSDDYNGETLKLQEHTAFYIQLHLQQLTSKGNFSSKEQFLWLQSCTDDDILGYPAVVATLAKAYQDRNQPDKAKELLLSRGTKNADDGNRIIAEMAMAQENYTEAVKLYDQALSTDNNNPALSARLVEALCHLDPQRAISEWKTIKEGINDDDDDNACDKDEDGGRLEMQELFKLIKHHGGADGNSLAAGTGAGMDRNRNKKSKESILRGREKQRNAYLEAMKDKGLFNPSRPTFPDPERWIPKHERQKRRRRGGAQNKASQGGVSARDAAKLDARASAADTGSSGPSSAHLTVAGGSRKGGRRR